MTTLDYNLRSLERWRHGAEVQLLTTKDVISDLRNDLVEIQATLSVEKDLVIKLAAKVLDLMSADLEAVKGIFHDQQDLARKLIVTMQRLSNEVRPRSAGGALLRLTIQLEVTRRDMSPRRVTSHDHGKPRGTRSRPQPKAVKSPLLGVSSNGPQPQDSQINPDVRSRQHDA